MVSIAAIAASATKKQATIAAMVTFASIVT